MEAAELYDVAIVGYGPTGATLANLLAKQGWKILVLDREKDLYNLPRAVHFDDETMRVFQSVGISDALIEKTHVNPGMRFVDKDNNLLMDWPRPQEITQHGWHASYRLHQPDLERLLRKKLGTFQSVTVHTECELQTTQEMDEQVILQCKETHHGGPVTFRARYVVGCDGANSTIRKFIDADMEDFCFCERWLVVDLLLKKPRPDLGDYSVQYCHPDRPMTYCRSPANRRRWEITVLDDESDQEISSPDKVWELLSRWITPDEAEMERSAVYTFRSLLARNWRKNRHIIAGDAAHLTPPFMGQGMCTGIRDASNLAWKLDWVLAGSNPDLLDAYEAERSPHARSYIQTAIRLGGLINSVDSKNALNLADNSQSMKSIQPKLGDSDFLAVEPDESHPVGKMFPQPNLANEQRFDEFVGSNFALITNEQAPVFDAAGLMTLSTLDYPELKQALLSFNASAVLVGPDRYIRDIGVTAGAVLNNFISLYSTENEREISL